MGVANALGGLVPNFVREVRAKLIFSFIWRVEDGVSFLVPVTEYLDAGLQEMVFWSERGEGRGVSVGRRAKDARGVLYSQQQQQQQQGGAASRRAEGERILN